MILDFQENGAVVLTSQEPGAFLNFRWESLDGSLADPQISVDPIQDISAGILYVNGLDISQEASIYGDSSINTDLTIGTDGDPSTASFHLYTRKLSPFDTTITFRYPQIAKNPLEDEISNWTNVGWDTFSVNPVNDVSCITSAFGYPGDYAYSNNIPIIGGLTVDVSFFYYHQGPGWFSDAHAVVTELPSNIDSSIVCSAGQNNIIIDSSTTTTSIRISFYAGDTSTGFGAYPIRITESGSYEAVTDVSILNRPYVITSDGVNSFESSNVQAEGDTSYLVLRTNPKFSGNIKLTVDSSNHLFLDTFKVSDVLSNKLYRKQSVSSNSVLSGDIRRVFSSMPLGEMYRLGDGETLNIEIPETEYKDQYDTEYTYGARLFKDELYVEDYSLLAPIWINNKLPDYFAVFRLDGQYNEESYPESGTPDYTGLAQKFLEDGELIKSWGIKESTPVGDYLRNHLTELQQVIAPSFISLSDPDLLNQDPNTWYGIAVDKGIIAGRSEIPYFFDQKANNFTDMNAFVSQGFERLNLLCPNLINMEYAFSDEDVSLYSMHRYFGLYLTENPLYEISYYAEDASSPVTIISLDGKDINTFFSSDIFDASGNISSSYTNRLFTLDDIQSVRRISNSMDADGTDSSIIGDWINKPGDNIFSAPVENISGVTRFISLEIENLLQQGETLRIIDKSNFKIWEIYGTNSELLEAGESWTYASEYADVGYPSVYRVAFSVKGTKEQQNQAIWNAWTVFQDYSDTPFKPYNIKDEGHSLILEDWALDYRINFQRMTAQTTDTQPAYVSLLKVGWEKEDWGYANTMSEASIFYRSYPNDVSANLGSRTDFSLIDYTDLKERNEEWTWIIKGQNLPEWNGGMGTYYTFDTSTSYLYAFWVKTEGLIESDVIGSDPSLGKGFYFGFDKVVDLESAVTGSSESDPYFAYTDGSDLEDDWYLVIGKINAKGTPTYSAGSQISGIYNKDGEKISTTVNDFRWGASASSSEDSNYRIGLANASTGYVFIQEPQLYEINGSEPSIGQLLREETTLSPFNTAASYNDIKFYGSLTPDASDFQRRKYDDIYGPINFELFGDRLTMDIDIFDARNYYLYSIDNSYIDLFEDNMLYLANDSWYRLVEYFDVSTATSRSLRYSDNPSIEDAGSMIMTSHPIETINNTWNAYSLYPITLSLMGINPVKDFDYTVYDSSTLDFRSEYWYKRDNDASTFELFVGSGNADILEIPNSYEILGGIGEITINGDTSTYNGSFIFNTFDNSAFIDASTDTRITYANLDSSVSFKSYKDGYSEEYIWDYYDSSTTLNYGLTVPFVTKWGGVGLDCRGNQLRLFLDPSILDGTDSNFIPYDGDFPGEIFYPSFKYLSPGDRNWEDYVFYDINDSIEVHEDSSISYSTFKDLMINEPYLDVFSKLLYSNNDVDGTKLRSSIGYYNNFKDSIDAIITGLRVSFSVRNNAKNVLDIQDWDRYRVSAIAVPSRNSDDNSPMEVYINENTETILLVWYQGNDVLNYTYRTSSIVPGKNLLDPSSIVLAGIQWRGFDSTDKHFSHIKTPFGVNNSAVSPNIFNIYGIDTTYDGSIASPFCQFNYNPLDELFSVFNAYNGNTISGTTFLYANRQYNTFDQYVNYTYSESESTYGDGIANFAYSYMKNENLYRFDTCSYDVLEDILTYNRIKYYIFRGDLTYTSDNFTSNPIEISINTPRSYNGITTYNGWYRPQFRNILNFTYNEDQEIIETSERDFTLGNTNLTSYDNIPQLWYNKVVEQVTAYDVSSGNAIDYVEGRNPFKSLWDSDYYFLYDQGVKSSVDGYNSTLELPSYFGSKLVSLPASIELENWDFTTTSEDFNADRLSLSYNLTRGIVNLFKSTNEFISNWSNLNQSDNVIDGYIKNTISTYYNISKPKIKVEIWRKPYSGGSRYSYTLDDTFTKWEEANIDGVLNYVNNEYIYTANISISLPYEYYLKFTLFEK